MEYAAELSGGAWSFACPDWVERLKAGRSLVPDLPLDAKEADRAVRIFNKLRLPDVPGQPPMAKAAGDWFRDIVRAAFGSLDRRTGVRAVSEVFALVPKKNSKTTGGAGMALTAALMNERPHAEILFVGPTQDVADLAFQQAVGMIEADDEGYLQKRFHVQEHLKTITDRKYKAKIKIKTFDMRVMTGAKPVVVVVDELHIMSQFAYASRVLGQIRGGLLPNPESLLIIITTQSDQPPSGVFRSELQYARGVRDGRITNAVRMLPVLYEFPEEMQTDPSKPWADPKYWPMVLPNLGRSITIDRLVGDAEAAKEKGEEEFRRWASQHLNVEIGLALHSDRWAGADHWEKCADRSLTLDEVIRRSEVIVVGIDGGGLDDLLGIAVLGRCRETKKWLLWSHAWAHEIVLERRKSEAPKLLDFEKDGDLTIVRLPGEDVTAVADIVVRIEEAGLLAEKSAIGVDSVGIVDIVDELTSERRGIALERIVGIAQGWKLSGSIKTAERKLAGGELVHGGLPMMAWCVGNAKREPKGNAVLITKAASGSAKIDPLMALFDAVALMATNPQPKRRPKYQMLALG